MQRFFTLLALLLCTLPVGLSITGCSLVQGSNPNDYCNGLGYGPKIGQLFAINLEPKLTGISLAFGQTGQLRQPTGTTCGKGGGASVSVSNYTYGSSNLQIADVNPKTGQICAGTWNRNSAGPIPNFTICTPPPPSAFPGGATGGTAVLTASAGGVTSNPVTVYVHRPISSITIPDPATVSSTNPNPTCVSQNHILTGPDGKTPLPLNAETTVLDNTGNPIPDGYPAGTPNYVGTITYAPVDPTIVSINNASNGSTNGIATALQPGSTVITATLSNVTSAAGYFYTCPPKSIALSVNGQTGTSTAPITVSPSSPQNIAAVVTDKNGVSISGATLDYSSTQPQQVTVNNTGTISAQFPTTTAINAICQPGTCNPAPINKIGVFGTGLPVVSNEINVRSTGRSSTLLWMASPHSQFFTPIDLTNGSIGTPVKLPYAPNSMVMDQQGLTLYFGSYRELMMVNTVSNALSKEDLSVPGVVLAVSPDGSTVVINDQLRKVIYLYTPSSGASTSIGGLATRAQFSPDGKNVYIVGPTNLYVHNEATGWNTYDISSTEPPLTCNLNNNDGSAAYNPFCSPDLAVTVPSAGAFLSGTSTTAHSFCPNIPNPASPVYYPLADTVPAATDHLTATNDGQHILGANASGQLSDIQFQGTPPTVPIGACPSTTGAPQAFPTTLNTAILSSITPTQIDQVLASPDSSIAFVTYQANSASGLLPAYKLSATQGSPGALSNVQLSAGAQAPIAGIFSPDNTIFFVSTTGDDLVHFVNVQTLQDFQTINPGLKDPQGNPVPAEFFAVKPRPTT